jgi:hypothetical protein
MGAFTKRLYGPYILSTILHSQHILLALLRLLEYTSEIELNEEKFVATKCIWQRYE